MTRHPLLTRALDRTLPLAERREAYKRWADEHAPHHHPGQPWHTHAGGDRIHHHEGGNPR
jgi:hypothetical protein